METKYFLQNNWFCFFILLTLNASIIQAYGQKNYGSVSFISLGKATGDVKLNGHQGKIEILKYVLDLKDIGLNSAKGTMSIWKPYDSSTTAWLSAYSARKGISSFELEVFLKNELYPAFKLMVESGKIINIKHNYNELSKQHEEEITFSMVKFSMNNLTKKQEVEIKFQ